MCTDAYLEALTRDLSSTASPASPSAPTPASAPSQRHATETGREGAAGWPLRRRANPGQDDLESRGVTAAGAADTPALVDDRQAEPLAEDALGGEVAYVQPGASLVNRSGASWLMARSYPRSRLSSDSHGCSKDLLTPVAETGQFPAVPRLIQGFVSIRLARSRILPVPLRMEAVVGTAGQGQQAFRE